MTITFFKGGFGFKIKSDQINCHYKDLYLWITGPNRMVHLKNMRFFSQLLKGIRESRD